MGPKHSYHKCTDLEYFFDPTHCNRYRDATKDCSKRDKFLFGASCAKEGKRFDYWVTNAKSWPEFWKQIKDFSLAKKIEGIEKYLDKHTMGVGSIVLEILVPEIALARISAEAVDKIREGKPPLTVVSSIAMGLIVAYVLKNEMKVLNIAEASLMNTAVQNKILTTKTGKQIIKKASSDLPGNVKSLIYNQYNIN